MSEDKLTAGKSVEVGASGTENAAIELPGTFSAPVIYFDGICGSGIVGQGAVIQIELSANVLLGHTGDTARQICVGHLRGSVLAMRVLAHVLNTTLSTFEKPEGPAN